MNHAVSQRNKRAILRKRGLTRGLRACSVCRVKSLWPARASRNSTARPAVGRAESKAGIAAIRLPSERRQPVSASAWARKRRFHRPARAIALENKAPACVPLPRWLSGGAQNHLHPAPVPSVITTSKNRKSCASRHPCTRAEPGIAAQACGEQHSPGGWGGARDEARYRRRGR